MRIYTYERRNLDHYPKSYMVTFLGFSDQDAIAMSAWCYNTFGPDANNIDFNSESNKGCRWRNAIPWGEVEFAREQDRMLFLLRWA